MPAGDTGSGARIWPAKIEYRESRNSYFESGSGSSCIIPAVDRASLEDEVILLELESGSALRLTRIIDSAQPGTSCRLSLRVVT